MINVNEIKRKGNYIWLGKGITAVEGMDGNMPTLTIRKNGKITHEYSGNSLGFSKKLTEGDKGFLKSLAKDGEKEYLVEWQEYNKETTETSTGKFQELAEAESALEAIELIKRWIFDETDKQEYPNIKITDYGIDLGDTDYRYFTARRNK